MSAELLELDDDGRGHGVGLCMKADGTAYLRVSDSLLDGSEEYQLLPTEDGIARAERIAGALTAWIEQVRRVGLVK